MNNGSRESGVAMARLESPDEVLVVAAILGNLEAFEELVLRYRAAVVAPGTHNCWRQLR